MFLPVCICLHCLEMPRTFFFFFGFPSCVAGMSAFAHVCFAVHWPSLHANVSVSPASLAWTHCLYNCTGLWLYLRRARTQKQIVFSGELWTSWVHAGGRPVIYAILQTMTGEEKNRSCLLALLRAVKRDVTKTICLVYSEWLCVGGLHQVEAFPVFLGGGVAHKFKP